MKKYHEIMESNNIKDSYQEICKEIKDKLK